MDSMVTLPHPLVCKLLATPIQLIYTTGYTGPTDTDAHVYTGECVGIKNKQKYCNTCTMYVHACRLL